MYENHRRGDVRFNPSLPPLTVPKFHGRRSEFATFDYLFSLLVDQNNPEPDYIKFVRLRDCLGPEPLNHIHGLGSRPGDYQIALRILRNEYADAQRPGDNPILQIESWDKIPDKNTQKLKEFRAYLRLVIGYMETEGLHLELRGGSSGTLLRSILQKLPDRLIYAFHGYINDRNTVPSILALESWLERRIQVEVTSQATIAMRASQGNDRNRSGDSHSQYNVGQGQNTGRPPRSQFSNLSTDTNYSENDNVKLCLLCGKDDHSLLENCAEFLAKTVSERWDSARSLRVCFRCLKRGSHRANECRSYKRCQHCDKPHHSLLHYEDSSQNTNPKNNDDDTKPDIDGAGNNDKGTQSDSDADSKTSRQEKTSRRTYISRVSDTPNPGGEQYSLRTVTVKCGSVSGKSMVLNCLLDDGSNSCFLSEDVARFLELPEVSPPEIIELYSSSQSIRKSAEHFRSSEHELLISNLDGSCSRKITVQSSPYRLTGDYTVVDWSQVKASFPHMTDCSFTKPVEPFFVDLIIGINCNDLHSALDERVGSLHDASARLTPLGWTAVGKVPSSLTSEKRSFVTAEACNGSIVKCCDIDQSLKDMMSTECPTQFTDGSQTRTEDELIVVDILENTLEYSPANPISTVSTIQNEPTKMPNNSTQAERTYSKLQSFFDEHPAICGNYCAIMRSEPAASYIRLVPEEEKIFTMHLLSYFPVIRIDRSTTRVRNDPEIQDELTENSIVWDLNCPLAPSFAGVYESLITCMDERALPKTLGVYKCQTDEEIMTILANAQGLMTARPLTVSSSDSYDLPPIIPTNFMSQVPVSYPLSAFRPISVVPI